jgi:hypothetical protein
VSITKAKRYMQAYITFKRVLREHYEGKALYAGLYHLYAEVHREMNETLLLEHANSNDEFRELKRRTHETGPELSLHKWRVIKL